MSVSQDTTVRADSQGCGDKRRLVKTKTPGVYKRVDGEGNIIGYVAVIEVAGKQRKRSARTYEAARRIKRESDSDRDRGELQEPTATGFLTFLDEWVERYCGRGRRGFRENTRDEYRRLIVNNAHPFFPSKLKLIDVTTFKLARFVDWLADEDEQGKRLSDSTIANIVIPLRAALTTANREGLIRPSCCSRCLRRPACGSARASRSSASTFRSTTRSLRFASGAQSSAGGSSRRRRSTASARCGCPTLSSTDSAPTSPRRRIRTRPHWSSRTGMATSWSTATFSAGT